MSEQTGKMQEEGQNCSNDLTQQYTQLENPPTYISVQVCKGERKHGRYVRYRVVTFSVIGKGKKLISLTKEKY
jgi:hypothetical protein